MSEAMLDAAMRWLALGVALIPLQPGGKRQVRGFGVYLKRITDTDAARYWFGDRRCNLGVVCGGGLVCLDFDGQADYARYGADLDTLTERTRRGYHVFVWDERARTRRVSDTFEVKAGGVVTVAPSVVGGVAYQVVKPVGVARVDLSGRVAVPFPLSESQNQRHWVGDGDDTVTRCKRALDILAVAQALQAARGLPRLRRGGSGWWYGLCPFHHERNPSYAVNPDKGVFVCQACGVRGDVLNLYQALHGLPDIQAAIADVARNLP